MKTAEELFKNNIAYVDAQTETCYMSEYRFKKALAEHDKKIISKIDELKQKYCLDKWFTKDDVNDILTELKEAIKNESIRR